MNKLLSLSALFSVLIGIAAACSAQETKPDRQAFLQEVLNAQPTATTSKFNAFKEENYRVSEKDLIVGLVEEANTQQISLDSVLRVGPVGIFSASYFIVFINEGEEKIRVNSIRMSHARITHKSTALISRKKYQEFSAKLLEAGVIQSELPVSMTELEAEQAAHYSRNNVLFSRQQLRANEYTVFYGNLEWIKPNTKTEAFLTPFNNLLKSLKQTYPAKKETKQK